MASKIEKLYGKELTGLLLEGLDWIANYSRYPQAHAPEHPYNPTQAIIAAALHALQREDVESFLKIHRAENLSYFQYPYMKPWLRDDHKFTKKVVLRCLTTLAWLVVEETLSSQSPLVAAVTALEEEYKLSGVFVQAVLICAKRKWKGAETYTDDEEIVEVKPASTQTVFEEAEALADMKDDGFTPLETATQLDVAETMTTLPQEVAGVQQIPNSLQSDNKEMDALDAGKDAVIETFCHVSVPFHKVAAQGRLETVVEVSEEEEMDDKDTEAESDLPKFQEFMDLDHLIPRELAANLKKDAPIHKAAAEGRLEVVMQLLDGGAEINSKGFGGYTALQYAAKYGHLSMVQSLLQRGADVNLGNDWNWTPLHHAAHYSRCDIAAFLIEAGASTQVVDTVYGKTPFSWATYNFKMIKLFKSKGIYY